MRATLKGLALATTMALCGAGLAANPATAEVPGSLTPQVCSATDTPLQLITFNDFHGRVDTYKDLTVKFAGTIEELRARFGEDSSVLISAGDAWGGSLFASSIAREKPAIDVLNAANVEAGAVGNHEFDRGWDFLNNEVRPQVKFPLLGANVYLKGTKTPALPEYAIVKKNGVRVMVIGAVIDEVPSLTSPEGVKALDFGNVKEAINRVVAAHANEADVIVADIHEGTFPGEESNTYEKAMATDAKFRELNQVDSRVNVILNGHTHQTYSWTGTAPDGSSRPVVSAKQYAERLGQVVLCVNGGKVTKSAAMTVAPTTTAPADLLAKFPRVAAVKTVTDKAVADADVIGAKQISCASAKLSRGTGRDVESTMTNAVANMFRDKISAATGKNVIGVQNPGGTRADMEAGPVSYKQAASILPFANMLHYTTLTGAEFKTMLEQQWQPGNPPRVLHLGLSDNVSWTYDLTKPLGDRVTSIRIDGKFIDPAAEYVVGSGNFLLAGGDNFSVFAPKKKIDTGLVDLDAWTEWLASKSKDCLAPSFAKHAVNVSPTPTEVGNKPVTVTLDAIDFSATEAPKNTSVMVSVVKGGYTYPLGAADVAGGKATIQLRNRFGWPKGKMTARFVVEGTGTVVELPLELK